MVCLVLTGQTSMAEIRSGAVTLSPSGGGYIFEGNQPLKNAPAYGFGLGYNFDQRWAIEGVVHFVDTELDYDGSNVDAYIYHLDMLYHFQPSEQWVPYVAAGLGGITFNPENGNNDDELAANYGAGLKYFFSENVAFRLDARHVISFDETYNNLLYTAGLSFSFGGEKVSSEMAEEKVVILAAEPRVEEKVHAAAIEPKIIVLAFEDVHFDFDQSTLKPEAKEILKRNIQVLKDNPRAQIRIAGYTSASGTDEYNQALSERRAMAVKSYLIDEGIITPDRLAVIGYGESNPAMHEAAPKEIYSQEAKANMRALFEIIVK
jgi:OOP family OmpA-OmpF porin